MGYKKIICKSDQEESIKALKQAVKREWHGDMITEESPKGEHASNGIVENAVARVQGMFRTFRDAFESRYGERMDGNSPIIPWMIRHAGDTINENCHRQGR